MSSEPEGATIQRPVASDASDVAPVSGSAAGAERWALRTFVLVLVAAGVVAIAANRHLWFNTPDEWRFLVERSASSLDDVLRAHNLVHWSTIPILVFRALYAVVGLDSYWPYVLPVIALHLTAAALLRVVMRRSGVHPWIATAAAGLFAFFGAGSQNILWAFQIGFNAALVLGLTHLLLADHDGAVDRRDGLGLAAGLIGLMCSGVAISLTLAVGIAVLARRGWRVAALHTVPLGAVYVVWYLLFADPEAAQRDRGTPALWAEFVWKGFSATFEAIGRLPVIAVLLLVLLVAGSVLAWHDRTPNERRRTLALPGSMLVAALAFLWITALGRVAAELGELGVVLGPEFARSSRYVHTVAALCLPALAVATDAIVRRWPRLLPVGVAVFLLGFPGNVADLTSPDEVQFREAAVRNNRRLLLTMAHHPALDEIPEQARPHPRFSPITAGWLRDAVEQGKVPGPGTVRPSEANTALFHLAVVQVADIDATCERIDHTADIDLEAGEVVRVLAGDRTVVSAVLVGADGTVSQARSFALGFAPTLRAQTGPVTIRFDENPEITAVERCS